ncbi:hypothetical protein [Lentzea sp. NPDC060358]|uniref:hypothetical protein n=1 Tax=Lentzea sp. NPDC060358 TaxID=3347103 RepID=UPI003652B1D5
MTARTCDDRLTWWLLTSVFGLLSATNAGLAITEATAWPCALAAVLLVASAWCARQALGLRHHRSAGAARPTVTRIGTAAPDTTRLSRLSA